MKDDAAKKLLDGVFQHSFDKDRFKQFIVEVFNEFTFRESSYAVWKEYAEYIESYVTLGTYSDSERKKIEVLVVKLRRSSSRDRARTMQRNFIAKFLKNGNKESALVAFYGEDPSNWRFSYVKMEYTREISESGKFLYLEELTPAKRYSFLVGEQEPNHTCRRQFLPLILEEQKNPSLYNIESCFSVENVTEEFFECYKKLFLELKESLESALEKNPVGKTGFQEKNISSVDFSKKLLGQIVFLYFLQKKGWLGIERDPHSKQMGEWGSGPKNFMRKLFEKQIVPYENFFNDILEPLFYEALADDRSANNDYYSRFKCKIPFLNGGLFEPINDYNWTDSNILLDNSIFERIFETFDRFNFTIKEDEPLEREVAIDPEVLGKVFENLLEIKDRKSKGAFYTPREIVHYMCQQSLIGYLENNSSLPREDLEIFVRLGDFALGATIQEQADRYYGKIPKKNQQFSLPDSVQQNYELLDHLLKEVKIIDPAVGSGAFPVGMMSEIVKARSILTPFFPKGKSERTNYELKRQTIENSLYGVDIDSSAVDIAKLRFWLSLIVDEENIKEIRPLPNLDHKIMCGDSLVEEFEGVKLFDESLLGEPEDDRTDENVVIDAKIEVLGQKLNAILTGKQKGDSKSIFREIEKLRSEKRSPSATSQKDESQWTIDQVVKTRVKKSRHKLAELKRYQKLFFDAQDRTKKQEYRNCIERLEWDLIEETLKETNNTDACKKLADYRKNKSKPFFIWKLYFAEVFQRLNPGFDIVIANPPYVRQESLTSSFKKYAETHYKYGTGTADLYVFFIERSHEMIRENKGIFCFICSNKYLKAKYGKKIRNYLASNTALKEIIDFGELPVFKKAATFPSILLTNKKRTNDQALTFAQVKTLNYRSLAEEIEKIKKILRNDSIKGSDWILCESASVKIIEKMKKIGTQLDNYVGGEINYGIKTGLNEVFVINEDTKKSLIAKDPKSLEIIKPFIVGDDIRKNHIDSKNRFLIFTRRGIQITKYPAILNYLEQFKTKLMPKPKNWKGSTWDGRKAGSYEWYEIQDSVDYFSEFEKIKIIYPVIAKKPRFTIDRSGYYSNDKTFIIPKNDPYLLGLLNSKLVWLFLKCTCSCLGDPDRGGRLELRDIYLREVPIPPLKSDGTSEKKYSDKLVCHVDRILSLNSVLQKTDKNSEIEAITKQIEEIDNQIDDLVYKLYGLTEEEIKYVEENVKF